MDALIVNAVPTKLNQNPAILLLNQKGLGYIKRN